MPENLPNLPLDSDRKPNETGTDERISNQNKNLAKHDSGTVKKIPRAVVWK